VLFDQIVEMVAAVDNATRFQILEARVAAAVPRDTARVAHLPVTPKNDVQCLLARRGLEDRKYYAEYSLPFL
jgi:hypothetical protein